MPAAPAPYIIGVIREREKGLLEDDEYTRIIQAPSITDAYHALSDTPYGLHLASSDTPLMAITSRLEEEYRWLSSVLEEEPLVLQFISARYDALHIAQALLDYKAEKESVVPTTTMGLISAELLTGALWNNTGWESVPELWRNFLQEERELIPKEEWSAPEALERVEKQFIRVLEEAATTELSKSILDLEKRRRAEEVTIRPDNLPQSITSFERQWDEELMGLLRSWRAEPAYTDAIIAWWFALTAEARSLRLILSAKAGGLNSDQLLELKRSLYRSWV